jgi:hypothetical protein
VTDYLSNSFRVTVFLSIPIVVLTGGCNHPRSTPQGRTATYSEVSQARIGKQITIRGKFLLNGKIAPYVLLDNQQQVYLKPHGSFMWGDPYSAMEGKLVEATGTLRFHHSPKAEPAEETRTRTPDHYYLEAETAHLQLINQ